MSYDTMHLRDDQILLADAFERMELAERINNVLQGAALSRMHSIYNRLMALSEQGYALSPQAYRELLRAIEEAEEAMQMRY